MLHFQPITVQKRIETSLYRAVPQFSHRVPCVFCNLIVIFLLLLFFAHAINFLSSIKFPFVPLFFVLNFQ